MPHLPGKTQNPFAQWTPAPTTPTNPSPLMPPQAPAETPAPPSPPQNPTQTPTQNQTHNYSSHESNPQAVAFTPPREPVNNAQRTSANTPAPYADAGVTEDGIAYAGAAAIKGRDENTGIEMEIYSASVQVGTQNEAQVGMARLGVSSDSGANNATMDIFTAQASAGIHNKDGSTGLNVGATAVAVGIEGTASTGASGVTGGLSVGVGGEVSVGTRDADGDGYGEAAIRVSAGFITVGIQIEDPRGWGVWDYFD